MLPFEYISLTGCLFLCPFTVYKCIMFMFDSLFFSKERKSMVFNSVPEIIQGRKIKKKKMLLTPASHVMPLLCRVPVSRHLACLPSGKTQVQAATSLASRNSNHEFPLPYPKRTRLCPTGPLTSGCSPKVSRQRQGGNVAE